MATFLHADFVLHNGRVRTLGTPQDIVSAIAIRGNRLLVVGSDEEVLATMGPETKVIDLSGRTVVPGLIDSHLHMHWAAMNSLAVQLLDARSIADVQAAIARCARGKKPGEWVLASAGWHESLLAEGRLPTRWELDEAAPDNPVFIPRGGHISSVNSLGLALAGIDKDTPDPNGGLVVRLEGSSEPSGVLLDTASALVRRVLPAPPSVEEQAGILQSLMRDLNRLGLVGVAEPGLDEAKIALYQSMRDAGRVTVRTDLMYRANNRSDVEKALTLRDFPSDDLVRFAGVKFMLDGGVEGARLSEPFHIVPGEQLDPDYKGLLMLPQGGEDEFAACLRMVAEAGLPVQCHGVGDVAIDVIIRGYERVNAEIPVAPLRWAAMHVHLPTARAIETMARIGIIATVQDHSVLLGKNMIRWWGRERAAACTPTRALLDAGLLVGGGTDAPVLPVDPFLSMWWMVTRKTLDGEVLGPEHAISASEALQLYTINNARVMGVAELRGSLEAGKLADLAVLSQDIVTIDPDGIRDTTVLLTMVDGNIVHREGI